MESSTVARNREMTQEPSPPAREPKRKSLWWIWLLILAVGAGYAYRHYRTVPAAQAQKAAGGQGRARGAGGDRSVPVVVAEAKEGDLPVYLNGIGAAAAFNTVTVRTRIDGQLTNVAFREGQFVHQGDLLVEIDPRPYEVQLEQAEGQYARDKAQLDEAKLNNDRNVQLFQQGIIPKQQVDSQQAVVGQFEGALKADQGQIDNAKLQLAYCRITAPISGQIGLRLVDPGNMVHANDANGLVVITQLQPIAVLFSLPQDSLTSVVKMLRNGANLRVDAFDRDNTSKIASGTLSTIDNQIDPNTGTYKLKAVFDNQDNLLFPNQFVNVHLLLETRHGLTIIPAAAIQRGPQGNFVYVVTPKKAVTVRPVKVELTEENTVGISEGLHEGDVVVIDGQDKLQEGARVDPRTPTGAPQGSRPGERASNDHGGSKGASIDRAGRRAGGRSGGDQAE